LAFFGLGFLELTTVPAWLVLEYLAGLRPAYPWLCWQSLAPQPEEELERFVRQNSQPVVALVGYTYSFDSATDLPGLAFEAAALRDFFA